MIQGSTSPRPEGPTQQSPGRKPGRAAGPVGLEAWVVGPKQGGGLKVRENAQIRDCGILAPLQDPTKGQVISAARDRPLHDPLTRFPSPCLL